MHFYNVSRKRAIFFQIYFILAFSICSPAPRLFFQVSSFIEEQCKSLSF